MTRIARLSTGQPLAATAAVAAGRRGRILRDRRSLGQGDWCQSDAPAAVPAVKVNRRLHREAMLQSMLSPGTATEHAFADDDSY